MNAWKGGEGLEEKFEARRDWFMKFKERSNFYNIKMQGETASAAASSSVLSKNRG